jgi:hypothetical protein
MPRLLIEQFEDVYLSYRLGWNVVRNLYSLLLVQANEIDDDSE